MFPGRESEFMAPELKESDVIEAMKAIPGYLDITPEDFRQLYLLALRHAWERLTRRTTAAEVMTRQVAAASADDTLDQVARIMAQEQVSGVPVLEGQRVVGVISERDFLDLAGAEKGRHFMAVLHNCLSGSSCIALPLKTKRAREVMSAPAIVVDPDTPLWQAWEIMRQKGVNRLPVVDEAQKLLGLVSRADLLLLVRPSPGSEV